ncbi:hypothetical protein GEMRC1_007346 [Eukaryota sp. GEM-RC1]
MLQIKLQRTQRRLGPENLQPLVVGSRSLIYITMFFFGLEGGGTSSHYVLIHEKALALIHLFVALLPSVPSLLDLETVAQTVSQIVFQLSSSFNFTLPLHGIALALSGVDNAQIQQQLRDEFNKQPQPLSTHISFYNDSVGSAGLLIDSPLPIVLIAGTGSHCRAVLPSGQQFRSGGWGHLLSEKGCAYNVTATAVAECLMSRDHHPDAPNHDVSAVHDLILEKFNISDLPEVLTLFYRSFNKAEIAGVTRDIAELALGGDVYAQSLFDRVGTDLAKMLIGVLTQIEEAKLELKDEVSFKNLEEIDILAVGSVWKSYSLFSKSFINTLNSCFGFSVVLKRPVITAAVGAVQLLAKEMEVDLRVDDVISELLTC